MAVFNACFRRALLPAAARGPPAEERSFGRPRLFLVEPDKDHMRVRYWLLAAVVVAELLALTIWWITARSPIFSERYPGAFEQPGDPTRGQLVFAAGDCASCHALPGQPDRLRLGGGLALASSFGTFRAPNISMDPVDGIGSWRPADLANALLRGVAPGGSHYYPVFPYSSFAHMSFGDVNDLWAYLRTLPAVSGRAPPHDLNALFRIRRFVGLWKLLYFEAAPTRPDPQRDAEWNRGRYLVEGPAHCAECHSSRNIMGGIKENGRFAGGVDPEGTGYYPDITPRRIGSWSVQDIAQVLTTGDTPDHGRVGASMNEVVTNTAMLPEADRRAIATYIKSLPPQPAPGP
jgi:mono/diheme cytochrome c family protein